jgi:hypothetical protein
MQRQILFKAQRADGKGWVEGNLVVNEPTKSYRIFQDFACVTHGNFRNDEMHLCSGELHLVIPETVCQYTGLNDKNGTRIFEGDIDKERRVIIWNDKLNLHCLHRKNRDEYLVCYYPFTKRDAIDIEIIGNLHDKNEK